MRVLSRLILAGIIAFVVLQCIRPDIPSKAASAEIQVPPEIRQILDKSCYSCHSDERRLAWFDQVVPAYWLVRHDVLTAREHLNFSTIGSKPGPAQRAALYEAVNMIQLGAMPLPSFVKMHSDAKVTPEQLTALKAYLAPWSQPLAMPAVGPPAGAATEHVSLDSVTPEFNGVAFDPSFKSWKLISTTDRGDNNTFRFILGNEIAIKAAVSGNTAPWPDGTRFAKIAWQQRTGISGLVQPGSFIQVELMVKDANRYRSTDGWGWGRWRGLDLKPYGTDAKFVNECTGCHLPVRGDDYVYSLPVTAAKIARDQALNNNAAALPANLPWQPLGWRAITMYVDRKTLTTATLFGNDLALHTLETRGDKTGMAQAIYPAGAVLALVTWTQREDPHWFGARIPDVPLSVEFVELSGQSSRYRRFAGANLAEELVSPQAERARGGLIMSLEPAQLP